MKTRIFISSIIMIPFISCLAMAQDIVVAQGPQPILGRGLYFFSALVCGVLLALAFNLVLTNLAIAAGITIASPEDKIRPGASSKRDKSEKEGISTIKKANHLFGLWKLIAASISLFFASWLAIEISGAATIPGAVIIALSVWSGYYLIRTTLELNLLKNVVSGLFSIAASTVRTTAKGVQSVFEKSPESRAADIASEVTASVRDEIFNELDTSKLRKELQSYIKQLTPISARDIRKEVGLLLKQYKMGSDAGVEDVISRFEKESPNQKAKSWANQVRQAIETFRQQQKSGKDTVTAGIETVMQMSGQSEQESQQQREQIESYLRQTNKQELQPEEIKHGIEMLFTRPKEGLRKIGQSIRSIVDHDTAVTLLEQRRDMSHEEAESIAANFEQAMKTIFSTGSSVAEKAGEKTDQLKENIESRLRSYLDSLDEPDLDYDGIKDDVSLLLHDPKAGADALISRLKMIDRDTIKSILASRQDISEERAERIISKIEEARDTLIQKANKMKFMVEEKLSAAQAAAADAAEQTRKNIAIAATWALAAAVISGVCAVLGGYAAMVT